MQQLRL